MEVVPRVRVARVEDAASIERLLRTSGDPVAVDAAWLSSTPGRRHVLVVDGGDDELAAIAVVRLLPPHGHVDLLAVAPEHRDVARRLLGVAAALCDAFGCSLVGQRAVS